MKKYSLLIVLGVLFSCVNDFDHSAIDTNIINPNLEDKTVITFQELYNLHSNEIGKDTVVVGYVVSSDQQGNFYKEIYVQNTLGVQNLGDDDPRMGMKIRIGLTTTSIKYVQGRKIAINLEGLKRTTSNNLLTIGKPSNTYIKDISSFDLDTHIYKMDEVGEVTYKTVQLLNLSVYDLNTLVKVENLHFDESQIGIPFAGLSTDDYDGKRTITQCGEFRADSIFLETSNFADFSDQIIPNKQVDVLVIYTLNFDKEPVLNLNKFEDLIEVGAYENCEISVPNILITEVADPQEETKSRFVEIYNTTENDVNLNDWKLVRYNYTTSKNTKELAALPVSLDEFIIPAKDFIIVTRDETIFNNYFGVDGNVFSSNLDGNGDDAYELIDPFGEVIDVYGNPNIDGSNSDWEYTDGFAKRKQTINTFNKEFEISEWEVKQDQDSYLSYSPRVR